MEVSWRSQGEAAAPGSRSPPSVVSGTGTRRLPGCFQGVVSLNNPHCSSSLFSLSSGDGCLRQRLAEKSVLHRSRTKFDKNLKRQTAAKSESW